MADFSNFTLLHTSTGFFDFSKNLEEGRQGGRMQNREWEKEFKSILTNFTICTRTSFIYENYQLLNYRRKYLWVSVKFSMFFVFRFGIFSFYFCIFWEMNQRTVRDRCHYGPILSGTTSCLWSWRPAVDYSFLSTLLRLFLFLSFLIG